MSRVSAPCWCGSPTDWGYWCAEPTDRLQCLGSVFHDPRDTHPTAPPQRLYVSGPMTGYPQNNYPAFHAAAADLRSVGYTVVNPAEYGGNSPSYREILKEDIRQLTTCDAVAVLEGWWNSRGARLEVDVAGVTQMPVRPLADWVDMRLQEGPPACIHCGEVVAGYGYVRCADCLARTETTGNPASSSQPLHPLG